VLTYRATHPRGYESVRQARRAVLAFAAQCGFNGTALYDVESATGEALANAAEHGNRKTWNGFEVTATFDDSQLVITVKDNGSGFDCDAALERGAPDASGSRGFGIHLMRTLMDEVAYSDRGSCVQLVKRKATSFH
jgi:anti-sigma regulatory factor (Ser/Thr protein kinase)